jgi:hypothetical protein
MNRMHGRIVTGTISADKNLSVLRGMIFFADFFPPPFNGEIFMPSHWTFSSD